MMSKIIKKNNHKKQDSYIPALLTQEFLLARREALLPRELSLFGDSAHKGVA